MEYRNRRRIAGIAGGARTACSRLAWWGRKTGAGRWWWQRSRRRGALMRGRFPTTPKVRSSGRVDQQGIRCGDRGPGQRSGEGAERGGAAGPGEPVHGDGLLDGKRFGPDDPVHAGRGAGVPEPSDRADRDDGGAGEGIGAEIDPACAHQGGRAAVHVLGRQGWIGRDHGGDQLCHRGGQGSGAEGAPDRSGSAAGRCGAEPGADAAVLDRGCAAELLAPGWQVSFQAIDAARTFGDLGAGGAGQAASGSIFHRGGGQADQRGAVRNSMWWWWIRGRAST